MQYGELVQPLPTSASTRQLLRSRLQGKTKQLVLERRGGYVRPLRHLPSGEHCAVADLGECGDRKCGNYRLNPRYAAVRPDFLDFCVAHILQSLPKEALRDGIVYCSLGSGRLFFDWELLERLTVQEGVRLRAVQLLDKDYGKRGRKDALRALETFAGWFSDHARCAFRTFLSTADLEAWVERSHEEAHILMDCDAVGVRKRIDVARLRTAVLRADGLCLVLSNPAKRTAIQKRLGSKGYRLKTLQQQWYHRLVWQRESSRSRATSSSSSETRADRRRRSRSRRRQPSARRRHSPAERQPPSRRDRDECCRCCQCCHGDRRNCSRSRSRLA